MKRIAAALTIAVICILIGVRGLSAQSGAGFSWSTNAITLGVGETRTVTLTLTTGGSEVVGVDAVFSYEPATFDITDNAFAQSVPFTHNFFNKDTSTSRAKLTSTYDNIGQAYNGTTSYVTLTIQGVAPGTSSLAFVCSQNATNDTNIMQRLTNTDLVNCAGLTNLSITVTGGTVSTPTPDPTTAPTAAPTAGPTAAPTNTPAATNPPNQTSSPTSTPSSGGNGGSTTCSTLQTAPSNLKAVAQSNNSVLLTWTKEPNAKYYTLKYGVSTGNYQFGALNIGNNSSFLVTNLKASTTYYFAVAGRNDCSTSPFITASARTLGSSVGSTTTTTRSTPRPNTGTTTLVSPTPFVTSPSFDNFITENTQGVTNTVDYPSVSDELPGDLGTPEPEEDLLSSRRRSASVLPFNLPLPILLGLVAGIVVLCLGIIFFVTRRAKTEEQPVTTEPGGLKEV